MQGDGRTSSELIRQNDSTQSRRWIDYIRPLAIVVLCFAVLTVAASCRRKFHRDDQGRPHGTGTEIFKYSNGAVRVVSEFRRGELIRTTWYKPDGTVVATTDWIDGRGFGYHLRDDGSVLAKAEVVDEVFHGKVIYFHPGGTVERIAKFERGAEISGTEE